MADLSVKIAGVEFPNPVIAASGTYGNGECFTCPGSAVSPARE